MIFVVRRTTGLHRDFMKTRRMRMILKQTLVFFVNTNYDTRQFRMQKSH